MSLIMPMPSPNGTNHCKLYILQSRNANMALDSAPSPSPLAEKGVVETLVKWAIENMNADEMQQLSEQLVHHLGGESAPTSDAANSVARTRFEARQAQPAMDSRYAGVPAKPHALAERERKARQDFETRFPDAARLQSDNYGRQPPRPRTGAKAAADFYSRFPEAKKGIA
jgi:hypothetical protein